MENLEVMKNAWDRMGQAERIKFAEQHKDNANFQQFAKQYSQGATPAPTTPQPSNPQPAENNTQNQTSANGQNWGNGVRNQQTSPQPSYDPNEQFDSSSFNNPNAQVQVQAGNAKQTGMPDYQDDSDARMGEITNNLNAYWNTNREYFADRATFNKVFSYDKRSEAQQAHFDSFWKRKEDIAKISGYTDGNSVYEGMQNAELTKDQMDILKEQFPDIYRQYQEKVREADNLRIVNQIVPNDTTNNVELLNQFMEKLGISGRAPIDIDKNWNQMAERMGIFRDNDRMMKYQDKIAELYDQMAESEEKIRAQSTGASQALIDARIQKAKRGMLTQVEGLQAAYSAIVQGRNASLAVVNSNMTAMVNQANEEQKIFNNKLEALGFAKGLLGFETPEQQRQGQIRQLEAQNQLTLQFEKDKIALQSELSDINSKDPKIQFNAVMKALDPHYKEFGSIILRPQAQAAQDIINLAKREKISVGEAMRKNFTEPLQKKDGYKMLMNKDYGISNEPKEPKIVNIGGTDYQYDPSTGEYRLPQLSNGTSFTDYQMKGRANRHNNPTAMTTDVAKSLGMVEGVDYVRGDSFGNGRYYTAKLLGNGVETTINAFDKTASDPNKKIFYTQSGKQRWTYLAMSDEEWLSLSQEEKIGIIQRMYNNEEQRDRRNFGAFGYSGGKLSQGSFVQSREPLYMNYLSSGKLPDNAKLKSMGLSADKFAQEAIAYGESIGGIETKEQKKEITDLRKEFNNSPEAKAFAVVKPMYETVKNTAELKTAAGDLSLIFAYMKILDPNSTVREGEFANAQNAGGVDDKIRNLYNKVMKGTRLSDRQRKDFVNNAGVLYNSYAKEYNTKLEQWKSYSIEGGDTNRIGTSANIFGVGGNTLYADIATSLLNESGTGAGSVASFDSNNPLSYIAGN